MIKTDNENVQHTILNFAKRKDVNFIFIGYHGRKGLKKFSYFIK